MPNTRDYAERAYPMGDDEIPDVGIEMLEALFTEFGARVRTECAGIVTSEEFWSQAWDGPVMDTKMLQIANAVRSSKEEVREDKCPIAYAESLARQLHERHYSEVTDWKPLSGDLLGLLTQIDNMTSDLSRSSKDTG